jgi:carbonic anhydrase/acetyltransferase-like protein (isoleucine patch superfamily)
VGGDAGARSSVWFGALRGDMTRDVLGESQDNSVVHRHGRAVTIGKRVVIGHAP